MAVSRAQTLSVAARDLDRLTAVAQQTLFYSVAILSSADGVADHADVATPNNVAIGTKNLSYTNWLVKF